MLLQYLISAAATSLGTLLQNFLVTRTVTVHHPRLFVALSTGLAVAVWSVNQYILTEPHWACDLLVILQLLLFAVLFTARGQRVKGLLSITFFLALQLVTNYSVGSFAFPIAVRLGYPEEALLRGLPSILLTFFCYFLYCPIVVLVQRILQKRLTGLRLPLLPMLFLLIPLSQVLGLYILIDMDLMAVQGGSISPIYAITILLSLSADIVFCIGLLKIRKTDRLEQHIRMAQEQLNVQTSYYSQLQENILTINQIRHDLNNQLQTAYYLMEQGETFQARSQLDQLQRSLQNRIGPRFCANLVVDAVLAQKADLCRKEGIHLDIYADLPEMLPIDSAHLCSAFSNLLDNGIQGSLACAEQQKLIELKSVLQSDCLIIRCSNTAQPPAHKRHSENILRSHGLGLDILRRIADEYDGQLETRYENGRFETDLILKF